MINARDGTHNELNVGPAHKNGPRIMGLYLELRIKEVGGLTSGVDPRFWVLTKCANTARTGQAHLKWSFLIGFW